MFRYGLRFPFHFHNLAQYSLSPQHTEQNAQKRKYQSRISCNVKMFSIKSIQCCCICVFFFWAGKLFNRHQYIAVKLMDIYDMHVYWMLCSTYRTACNMAVTRTKRRKMLHVLNALTKKKTVKNEASINKKKMNVTTTATTKLKFDFLLQSSLV